MKRSKPLRRKRPLTVSQRQRGEAWHSGIRGKRCAVCGRARADDGHHIIRLQTLRRWAVENGFDFERVRWDTRNRLAVCRGCHEDHHSGKRRISQATLWKHAPKVFQFAKEVGLARFIDREYVHDDG